uniref:Uncharacterized protein n=1 Tax=Lotharella vacuolata TaxID=74820 RepID=A0A0H5BHK4_9EUKA|nr:hypothetical protein [Lotharella vacuolata]
MLLVSNRIERLIILFKKMRYFSNFLSIRIILNKSSLISFFIYIIFEKIFLKFILNFTLFCFKLNLLTKKQFKAIYTSNYSLDIFLNISIPKNIHIIKNEEFFGKKLFIFIYDCFLKICLCFKEIYFILIVNYSFDYVLYKKNKMNFFKNNIISRKFKFIKPICYMLISYLKKKYLIDSSIIWIGILNIQFYLISAIINNRVYKLWLVNLLFKKKVKNVKMISIIFKKKSFKNKNKISYYTSNIRIIKILEFNRINLLFSQHICYF